MDYDMVLRWAFNDIVQFLMTRIWKSMIVQQENATSHLTSSCNKTITISISEKVIEVVTSPEIITNPSPSFFHLFSDLPPELRLQIWRMSLPPRQGREIGPRINDSLINRSNTLPHILWVNHESRSLAIQANNYTIRSPTIKSLLPHQGPHFSYIVDYDLDTFIFRDMLNFLHYISALLFYGEESSSAPLKNELGKIRNLKIVERRGEGIAELVEKYLRLVLPVFEGLRVVVFEFRVTVEESISVEGGLVAAREKGASVLEEYKGRWEEEMGKRWTVPEMGMRVVELG